MKKIILTMALAMVSVTGYSQFTVFEDFNDEMAPSGWFTIIWRGTCDFQFGTDLPTGDPFITPGWFFDDDACGNNTDPNDVSISSATFNLLGATTAILTVDVAFQESGDQYFDIEVWDGGTKLDILQRIEEDMDPDIQTLSYDVTSYVSANMRFLFTFNDDPEFDGIGGWGWHGGIDNFKLETDALGVVDNSIIGFNLYPNPTTDILNMSANENIDQVAVYDLLGRKVMEQNLNAANSQMDVSVLSAGTYILKVTSGNTQGSYKFIKR